MNWYQLLSLVIAVLGVGGVISGVVLRRINKMDKRMEERAHLRVRENVLILQGIRTIGNLAEVTAEAVETGHANGNIEQARIEYDNFCKELNKFMQNTVAEKIYE